VPTSRASEEEAPGWSPRRLARRAKTALEHDGARVAAHERVRLDEPDRVAARRSHIADLELSARAAGLDESQGASYVVNTLSEEVFTTPHARPAAPPPTPDSSGRFPSSTQPAGVLGERARGRARARPDRPPPSSSSLSTWADHLLALLDRHLDSASMRESDAEPAHVRAVEPGSRVAFGAAIPADRPGRCGSRRTSVAPAGSIRPRSTPIS